MANGLGIAGIAVRVRRDTWSQVESFYMGARVRMFDNTLFSTERDERRVWEGEAYFLDQAEEEALRAACPRGIGVLVSGELVGGDLFYGTVDMGPSSYKYVLELGVQALHRTMPLHIEEA